MVDLGSLVLLMSIFGARVAVIYVAAGLVIAVCGGTLIQKLRLDNQVEPFVRAGSGADGEQTQVPTQKERLQEAAQQAASTFRKVLPYILVGVGVERLFTTGSRRIGFWGCWGTEIPWGCSWQWR